LPVVEQPGLRPTSERIRETLFNWLSIDVPGATCLDLFAGSGALGFEALSRGAKAVTFVETSAPALRELKNNIVALGAEGATAVQQDARAFLRGKPVGTYDIVFLDPPFADDLLEECCRLLQSNGWLKPAALVYLEQGRRQDALALPGGWRVEKEKTAGNVRYSLIRAGIAPGKGGEP
jgi:16S rRNA (guanine966-N2)-methyltransferase